VEVEHKRAKGIIVFRWKLLDQVRVLGGLVDGVLNGGRKDKLVMKDICQ
jgi:hypothetical protein